MLTTVRSQDSWAAVLRNLMPQDLAASYLWLSLACGPNGSRLPERERRDELLRSQSVIPLFAFKFATTCGLTSAERLHAMLEIEPRFGELNYYLGLLALGGQTGQPPNLDAADKWFRAAYESAPTSQTSRSRWRMSRCRREGLSASLRLLRPHASPREGQSRRRSMGPFER